MLLETQLQLHLNKKSLRVLAMSSDVLIGCVIYAVIAYITLNKLKLKTNLLEKLICVLVVYIYNKYIAIFILHEYILY
jgi:hypothetical protein